MSLLVPATGEVLLLQYLVNMVAPTNQVMHLYNNDPTVDDSVTLSTITEVPSGIGYVPITMVGTLWTTSSPGGVGTALYSDVTFTFSTTQNVYGYFVTNTGGALLYLEKFTGAPFAIPATGGTITVTPRFTGE